MRNVHVTFVSIDHNCFRKKLYQFNLNLIEELGLNPSQYILHPPKPSFGLLNNSHKEDDENDDENVQETGGNMENNHENNHEGNENEEEDMMDHIMVLPPHHSHHVFNDDDNDDNDQDGDDRRGYVIFLSFQN
jgi:hypothetical protein